MNTKLKDTVTHFSTNDKQLKISLLNGISKTYLNAAKVIADVSLPDIEVLEAIGQDTYSEFEHCHYQLFLVDLINPILEKYEYSLIRSLNKFQLLKNVDLPGHVKSPNLFPHDMTPKQIKEVFFDESNERTYDYTSTTCALKWDIRGGLFTQMSRSLQSIEKHLFGKDDNHTVTTVMKIFRIDSQYSEDSSKLVKRELLAELRQVPDSFAQACHSQRVRIAKKLNDNQACLDLVAIQSEETVNILLNQLANTLSSKIHREVTVKLNRLCDDEPDGYICTEVPDEAALKAASVLLSRRKLPRELRKLIGKPDAELWFCKNIQDPMKSVLIFEGVALSKITIAEQLHIHIGTPIASF